VNASSNLSHENRARGNRLASEDLHASSLAVAIAAIT
jgi:hypothetical protein